MSVNPELQTLCPTHQLKISAACFYKGCNQNLLCRKCYRDHPMDHDLEIKDMVDLIDDNSWIEACQTQRNAILAKVEGQKGEILSQTEKMLSEFIQSTISTLEAQKQLWLRELKGMVDCSGKEERQLDANLAFLMKFDLKGNDVFEKISKVKSFNENVLANERQLIESFQGNLEKWRANKEKMERYKAELVGMIKGLGLKGLLGNEPFKSLKPSGDLVLFDIDYREFQKNIEPEIVDLTIEDFSGEVTEKKDQWDEIVKAEIFFEEVLENFVSRQIEKQDVGDDETKPAVQTAEEAEFVEMIMFHTKCTREEAIEELKECNGDAVTAIINLVK